MELLPVVPSTTVVAAEKLAFSNEVPPAARGTCVSDVRREAAGGSPAEDSLSGNARVRISASAMEVLLPALPVDRVSRTEPGPPSLVTFRGPLPDDETGSDRRRSRDDTASSDEGASMFTGRRALSLELDAGTVEACDWDESIGSGSDSPSLCLMRRGSLFPPARCSCIVCHALRRIRTGCLACLEAGIELGASTTSVAPGVETSAVRGVVDNTAALPSERESD